MEAIEDDLGEPVRDNLVKEVSQQTDTHSGLAEIIQTNLMLNWVINCESSNRHEGIWGSRGEYGILQYKEQSFNYFAEKYNFTGDWRNKDDQIGLFLLLTDQERYDHWTCFRKYKNQK